MKYLYVIDFACRCTVVVSYSVNYTTFIYILIPETTVSEIIQHAEEKKTTVIHAHPGLAGHIGRGWIASTAKEQLPWNARASSLRSEPRDISRDEDGAAQEGT